MRALALVAATLAACDFGIGTDPRSGPRSACLPGHERIGPTSACFTAFASIAIDGATDDWAEVPPIAVAPACAAPPCDGLAPVTLWLAAGGDSQGDSDLFVRASFGSPPPATDPALRVAIDLAASPVRPATTGSDRLVVGAAAAHYEKTGYTTSAPPNAYAWAWTADGFEATVAGSWLTLQGAARITVGVERAQGGAWTAVAPTPQLDVCWGWRGELTPLPSTACEVARR